MEFAEYRIMDPKFKEDIREEPGISNIRTKFYFEKIPENIILSCLVNINQAVYDARY
jgi:hypothetical protein